MLSLGITRLKLYRYKNSVQGSLSFYSLQPPSWRLVQLQLLITNCIGTSFTLYLKKMVRERAHCLKLLCMYDKRFKFQKQNRKETEIVTWTEQFTQGYNILHRLKVHHLTLAFIIHNKYISTLYLYTYIIHTCNIMNCFKK